MDEEIVKRVASLIAGLKSPALAALMDLPANTPQAADAVRRLQFAMSLPESVTPPQMLRAAILRAEDAVEQLNGEVRQAVAAEIVALTVAALDLDDVEIILGSAPASAKANALFGCWRLPTNNRSFLPRPFSSRLSDVEEAVYALGTVVATQRYDHGRLGEGPAWRRFGELAALVLPKVAAYWSDIMRHDRYSLLANLPAGKPVVIGVKPCGNGTWAADSIAALPRPERPWAAIYEVTAQRVSLQGSQAPAA